MGEWVNGCAPRGKAAVSVGVDPGRTSPTPINVYGYRENIYECPYWGKPVHPEAKANESHCLPPKPPTFL